VSARDEVRSAVVVQITEALTPNVLRPGRIDHNVLKAELRTRRSCYDEASRRETQQHRKLVGNTESDHTRNLAPRVGLDHRAYADMSGCARRVLDRFGRIDRFTFTSTEITCDGLAYDMNNAAFLADGISCAEGTEVETG